MDQTHLEHTKRIAKNTVMLYGRTLIMLIVNLYTSRIILEALGVDNYGINNVVGGVVGMFSILSGPLSGSISRFLTVALGEGDADKLRKLFSLSINIQIALGITVVLIAEPIGIWFINNKLNIPPDRLIAAHWVFQCAIVGTFIGLINVPYNACLIAHERMGVFANMTIVDVAFKLLFAYLIFVTPFDRLITCAVLNMTVGILMRIFYGWYCTRHFEECHYELTTFDKPLIKEMTNFAWWGFFGNTAWMFNTQGVNILINIFFGVVYNAARGVAGQVEGAVMGFVGNFTTAFNPQIMKSYASGDHAFFHSLICRCTKFSFYLILFFAVPLWFEAEKVLSIWLTVVPDNAAAFLKLSLICTIITNAGSPILTGIQAVGTIRNYQLVTTVCGCLVFPLTYIAYKLGLSIFSTYFIYMTVYALLIWIKIWFAKKLFGMSEKRFLKEAIAPMIIVWLLAPILPLGLYMTMPDTVLRLLLIVPLSIFSTGSCIYLLGLSKGEKTFVRQKLQMYPRLFNRRPIE